MTPPLPSHRRHSERFPAILPKETNGSPLDSGPSSRQRQKFERSRRNVSRACQACRRRRIRCAPGRPCVSCVSNRVDCVDDVGPDGVDLRTIRSGLNNQDPNLQPKALLVSLFRSIRAGTADNVITCIKEGGSLQDVAQALEPTDSLSTSEPAAKKTAGVIGGSIEEHKSHNRQETSKDSTSINEVELRVQETFGNLPLSSSIKVNGFPSAIQEQQIAHLSNAVWECSPLINDDPSLDDAFSKACLDFRNMARQQLANGACADMVLSSKGIELDLLFRNRSPNDPHTVSTWACELLKTFSFLPRTVQLAAAEAVACLMRWLISPTKQHYQALPATSRPTESQFFVPHPIGVDIIMFPDIRNALLARRNVSVWTSHVRSTTMDFNWPYGLEECLELVPCGDGGQGMCMRLSKAFVDHIRDMNNFSLDREVLKVFPEFEGKFRWHTSTSIATST